MTTDDMEIVSALRAALADKVGADRFELWFGESTRLHVDDGRLCVAAPSRILADWLRTNFRHALENAALACLGYCPELQFTVDPTLPSPGRATSASTSHKAPHQGAAIGANGGGAAKPAIQAASAHSPRPGSSACAGGAAAFRLEGFVAGPSNQLAYTAATMTAQRPGEFSPLVVHGPTGVGKTHLLRGILAGARRARAGLSAVHLSAEQFAGDFFAALRGGGLPSFRQKYRGLDLLLIDDLQFFSGKRYTKLELLYTVDALGRDGRQVVFAADRAPHELADLGPELVSRLQAGMVCRIDAPEYETRLGIAAQAARRMALVVPRDVLEFIASRFTAHARQLSGALCRLEATSRARGRSIDLALAEEALADMVQSSSRPIRLADIEKAVCEAFGLEPSSLQSSRKGKRVSQPRMLAMWLARKYTRSALTEIGQYFGRRSHSTVISAQKRIDGWLAGGNVLQWADQESPVDDAIRKVEQRLLAG